ncbi:unnamed protein product [Discosporangium mesarthrocarpum]
MEKGKRSQKRRWRARRVFEGSQFCSTLLSVGKEYPRRSTHPQDDGCNSHPPPTLCGFCVHVCGWPFARFIIPKLTGAKKEDGREGREVQGTPGGTTLREDLKDGEGEANGDGSRGGPGNRDGNKRGRNKKRPMDERPSHADSLCRNLIEGGSCRYGESCKFSHDVKTFVESKPPDLGERCPVWDARGVCPSGIMCRFGSTHIDMDTFHSRERPMEEGGVCDPSTYEFINHLDKGLQVILRRNKKEFLCDRKAFNQYLKKINSEADEKGQGQEGIPSSCAGDRDATNHTAATGTAVAQDATPDVEVKGDTEGEGEGGEGALDRGKQAGPGGGTELVEPAMKRKREEVEVRALGNETAAQRTSGNGKGSGGSDSIGGSLQNGSGKDLKKGGMVQEGVSTSNEKGEPSSSITGLGRHGEEDWVRSCLEARAPRESRKKLSFEGKVYVAPLTTVGNLPFRRVLKDLGADITCGEMALAPNLLKGQSSEWALLRRHPCEDVFGVQIAGGFPDQLTRAAQLVEDSVKVDFVDLNMGCPIDMVCNKGMGAALMNRSRKLGNAIAGMTSVLTCPVTVKMRVGWDEKKRNADQIVRVVQREASRSQQRGLGSVAAVMVHGRSRLQRYSRLADWEYIRQVVAKQDPNLPTIPVIGNGDILSWQDHERRISEGGGVSTCCMLARGALIKPWLPREVKEKRDLDISSSERMEIYKNFVKYGLEYWGSDQMGVNRTRRFLLEWLSFACRYIPVGLLERLPQRINEKPLPYFGRNDLETLMSSQCATDWVKISEMLLGPVPEGFKFEPKHKANSYQPAVLVDP